MRDTGAHLQPEVFQLYCLMAAYADGTTGYAKVKLETLALKLSISQRELRRRMKLLEAVEPGLIAIDRKRGAVNVYWVQNAWTL